jgi:hypothetical protein
MSETTAPPVPAKGLFARAIGVIFSPKETFSAIVARPKVLGAIATVTVLTALLIGGFMMTSVGSAAVMDQITKSQQASGRTMTPEQVQGMQRFASFMGPIYFCSILFFMPIALLIVTGVVYVIFNALMGGTATFKQLLAVVSHSWFVHVLGAVFVVPLNYFRGTVASATNLGVFLPMLEEKSFVASFLSAIDLVWVWWMACLAIGLGVLYRRKTGNIATVLYMCYGLIALVIAFFKSR